MAKEKKEVIENTPPKSRVKNYIILGFIYLCCISLTLYLCKWYDVYKEYEREIPVIRGSLMEITPEELEHYIVETSSSIIYMCTSTDDNCRLFEKDFKKYISRNDITDEVTYLNLTNTDIASFVDSFNKKYSYKIKLNGHYPAFVAFEDGKVISILQGNKKKELTLSKVKAFLEINLATDEEEIIEESKEE